ncbi:MAG: nucleoside kinase [Bacilli bacterium]|nr:nucleoside kinase [Bacilli bacterium]
MSTIKITFSDGTTKEYEKGVTYELVSRDFKGKYPYVGVSVDNVIFSLADKPETDVKVDFIDFFDPLGAKMYKCGVEFILEVALKELFKDSEIYFLHSHPKGVYAEIKSTHVFTDDDIRRIKSKMSQIVQENKPIKRFNVTKKDAIKFYTNKGYLEKASNIQNFSENICTFYVLEDYVNYFYSEMPSSTGVINLYDIKYIGDNKIVILLPNALTQGRVPEFIKYDGIINSFEDTQNWLECLGKRFLCNINDDISNSKIRDFMNVSELKFNDDIRNVVKEVTRRGNIKFVMIAGPSSSGKTTTTKRLKTYFDCCGYDTIVISTDDYFVDRDKNPKDENGNYDFECLHAVDTVRLNKDIKDLLEGKEVSMPVYDFVTGTSKETGEKVKLTEKSIVLIEGLHSLNDDLVPVIDNEAKYKVYISPFIGVNIDRHNYISTTDLRLIRRIVRDNRTRGRKVEDTISYWQSVRKGEVKYIFPYIHQADVILNTALSFEIGVLEVYAIPLLLSVGIDSEYHEEARRLLNFLKEFCPIPSEYVSKDSILREFIGGE